MSEGNGKPDVFADWQQEYSPKRTSVDVLFDGGLAARLAEIEERLAEWEDAKPAQLKTLGDKASPELEALRQEAEQLRAEARGKVRTLIFESVGRKRWRDLVAEHPPTEEQRKRFPLLAMISEPVNMETFPAPALAMSCVEPGLSLEEAEWIMEKLPVEDSNRVLDACMDANASRVSLPKALID